MMARSWAGSEDTEFLNRGYGGWWMDEFKIWALEDASSVVELEPQRQMDAESLLEDTLVANPDLLMPGFTLVGR